MIPMNRDSRLYGLLLLKAVLSVMAITYGIEFHIPVAWCSLVYRCACAVILAGLAGILALVLVAKPASRVASRTDGLTAWPCL
jgi:hypothetical protein